MSNHRGKIHAKVFYIFFSHIYDGCYFFGFAVGEEASFYGGLHIAGFHGSSKNCIGVFVMHVYDSCIGLIIRRSFVFD